MKTLGAGGQTISYRDIANEVLLVPQSPTQEKIANFLNTKIKEIERQLSKSNTTELLEEYNTLYRTSGHQGP